jgi:tRNA uridine 5-carboxymethylaminomethyl modification enzyme
MRIKTYDVIVIGSGHAGCEAALASSRMGCTTLLITLHRHAIGFLSCNPAIGGLGKGQLVKEVDALGGEIAKAADNCGIQFKVLNASKGPAVHSSRAQVDRKKYTHYMQEVIAVQGLLDVYEAEVTELTVENGMVKGIVTHAGKTIQAQAVIVTPGTFLNGLIHIGMRSFRGGRIEEPVASSRLSGCLHSLGFNILRFKTGTCARLDGRTIDFSELRIHRGDEPPLPFSFSTTVPPLKQTPCYITYTNEDTHAIIRENLDRSPLFSGKITGTGVRYCPSLEDKVIRFPHHKRHQIFLEPEGFDADEFYPNGLSTSLSEDVQTKFIRTVPGLENVAINRFGYGIEHDVVDATQLLPTLEAKQIKNLYLAGQINGTTGYEEAACQGFIAGVNAVLRVKEKPPFILDRSTSYIGVLIDDLVTKGTLEPYRMFTSRVEYRLILREDNADVRLRKFGYDLGLVSRQMYEAALEKQKNIECGIGILKETKTSCNNENISLYQLLKRPGVTVEDIKTSLPMDFESTVLRGIEIETKYTGFIQRQIREVKSFRKLEHNKIPPALDYDTIPGLSSEIREKLRKYRPYSLGQASRISGVTPSAITLLMVHIKKITNEKRANVLL